MGIQGRAYPDLTFDQLREHLAVPAGSTVELRVTSGKHGRRVRLFLRDLL